MLIRYLVGLHGEIIEIQDDKVLIDGAEVVEPYDVNPTLPGYHFGPERLGEDEFFILGDNGRASNDSRNFGPVTGTSIQGRVEP